MIYFIISLLYRNSNKNNLNFTTMKTITKQQVIEKLVSRGNSLEIATDMTEKHFEYATKTYSRLSTVCDCIRILY